jgi:NADH-quinone oxidoreductase subunit H
MHLPADVIKFWLKGLPFSAADADAGIMAPAAALMLATLLSPLFALSFGCNVVDGWDFQLLAYAAYAAACTLLTLGIVGAARSKYALIAAARLGALSVFAEVVFLSALFALYARVGGPSAELIAAASSPAPALMTPLLCLLLLAFILFEARRAPFDHTEAESELVAGHLIDFGGRTLLLLFVCEYAHVYFCVFAASLLLFGGSTSAFAAAAAPLVVAG